MIGDNTMGLFDGFKKNADDFKATSKFGSIKVDDKKKLFKTNGKIIPFTDLISFELLENGNKITEGGIGAGRAILGSVALGNSGAAIGGLSKVKKKDIEFCTSLKILLTLKNQKQGTLIIPFIVFKTDKSKSIYLQAETNAKSTIAGLNYILDSSLNSADDSNSFDELKKFKELLDLEIITQEEFEMKKKSLLDL